MRAKLYRKNKDVEIWDIFDNEEEYPIKIYEIYYTDFFGGPKTMLDGNAVDAILPFNEYDIQKTLNKFRKLFLLK